nr:hypothetical protein GCM10011355_27680 [Aquisalinus luteolus]
MIVFRNDGELDIRALTTFGLSVKGTKGAIGRFGTGLKYACAVILRSGGEIALSIGGNSYRFEARNEEFRGETKSFVYLIGPGDVTQLGFTTDLGRDWEPWQAFREIYSNCKDENGETFHRQGAAPVSSAGQTVIAVTLKQFDAIFYSLEEYFINPEEDPLWENDTIAVYAGRSKHIFYQGIRVHELKHPAAFRYNFKRYIELTEDRTVKYPFIIDSYLVDFLPECTEPVVCEKVVSTESQYERSLEFTEHKGKPSAAFAGAVVSAGCKASMASMQLVRMALPENDPNSMTVASRASKGAKELSNAVALADNLGLDRSDITWVLGEGLPVPGDYAIRDQNVILAEAILDDQPRMNLAVAEAICSIRNKGRPFPVLFCAAEGLAKARGEQQ